MQLFPASHAFDRAKRDYELLIILFSLRDLNKNPVQHVEFRLASYNSVSMELREGTPHPDWEGRHAQKQSVYARKVCLRIIPDSKKVTSARRTSLYKAEAKFHILEVQSISPTPTYGATPGGQDRSSVE